MKKESSLNQVKFDTDSEIFTFETKLKKLVLKQLKFSIHNRIDTSNKPIVLKTRPDFVFKIFKSPSFGIVTCRMCNKVKNSLPYHKRLCIQCYRDDENKDWDTW